MSKTFRLLIVAALLSLPFGAGKADAAVTHQLNSDYTGTLEISAGSLGVSRPATNQYFTASSGVGTAYHASDGGAYFITVAQHQKGDLQYAMHSSGGAIFAATVSTTTTDATTGVVTVTGTIGTWRTDLDAYTPTASTIAVTGYNTL